MQLHIAERPEKTGKASAVLLGCSCVTSQILTKIPQAFPKFNSVYLRNVLRGITHANHVQYVHVSEGHPVRM